jgi:hypothetical protein
MKFSLKYTAAATKRAEQNYSDTNKGKEKYSLFVNVGCRRKSSSSYCNTKSGANMANYHKIMCQ